MEDVVRDSEIRFFSSVWVVGIITRSILTAWLCGLVVTMPFDSIHDHQKIP
jgi:hypothetical protein